MPKKKVKQDRQAILDSLDPEVTRIQVQNEKGQPKWRSLSDLSDNDTIVLREDGSPYVMKGKPGRKAAVDLDPANPVVAEIMRRKEDSLKKDPIVIQTKETPESSDVLNQVLSALAEEAASLGFERHEAEWQGKETSQISVRRINALKAVGETWLRRKEQISTKEIDLESSAFKALFEFIMNTFQGALEDSGMRPEMVETVFAKISNRLEDDWENEARNRMKNS